MNKITDPQEATVALNKAWPLIIRETRLILAGELHYQAMVYHALRTEVAISQIGMNVKQWIGEPVSSLFQELDERKNERFRGGFEPIPDVVIFHPDIESDWRRRNFTETLKHMLLAIEVKASERKGSRLGPKEIVGDISKLDAHREEAQKRGYNFKPVMMSSPLVMYHPSVEFQERAVSCLEPGEGGYGCIV